ncbi:MAG: 30S ribosomal protein S1 [Deltaproteobacteria bacterium]|nr:30S ribosomal protein S1 [Deltaproteobacteria bacterium]
MDEKALNGSTSPQLPEDEDFAKLFEESISAKPVKEGEVIGGTIVKVTKDYVVVDIGAKSEGQVPIIEFGRNRPAVGDKVEVLMESIEDEEGIVVLSKEKADKLRVWDDISAAYDKDQVIEGVVVARVKGGLSVDIGVKAFLPGSQVDLRPVRNLDKLINEKLKFKIIKFNKKRGNIVLSRRVLLEKEREEQRKETLQRIKEGAVLRGQVKNITDYGAFVDLGGVDGLLHITDMSWGRVGHPTELFNIGDEINVRILKFDPNTERVSLGLKQITDDPWTKAGEKYTPNTRVKGKVVSLTDYGAFVEIEQGIEGLVHISEMSWTKRVKHPSKIVNIGDLVEAAVLDVDAGNKRISLGMKQLEPNPWLMFKDRFPPGTRVRGKVRNITDFGIFIGIDEGIDGLVHISDLSWTQRIKHPSEIHNKNDEVEAVVLNVDVENERFSLGIKQLTEDPWLHVGRDFPIGSKVQGKVVKVTDFGAFVELTPGVEGLLHVSELREERVESPSQVVKDGDVVRVMVIDLNEADRKIALSMKALARADETDEYSRYMGASESKGKLGDLLKKGGFVPAKPEDAAKSEAPADGKPQD